MLSNLLKNNFIAGAILLVLCAAGLIFFVGGQILPDEHGGLLFLSVFAPIKHPVYLRALSAVFLISGAFLLNYLAVRTETMSRPSFFPAFLYVIMGANTCMSFNLHPSLIASFLLLLGLWRVLNSYRLDSARAAIFDSAFFFSLATLFFPPSFVLLPVFFISLIVLRPYVWREWVFAFLGMGTPYFFTWGILFALGRLHLLAAHFSQIAFGFYWPSEAELLPIAFLFLLSLYAFLAMVSGSTARKVRQQKNLSLFNYWILLGIILFFIVPSFPAAIPFLLIPALSVRVGEWLGEFRKNFWSDVVLLSIMACCTALVLKTKGVF